MMPPLPSPPTTFGGGSDRGRFHADNTDNNNTNSNDNDNDNDNDNHNNENDSTYSLIITACVSHVLPARLGPALPSKDPDPLRGRESSTSFTKGFRKTNLSA